MGVNAASGTYTKLVDEWYITIDGRFAIYFNCKNKKKIKNLQEIKNSNYKIKKIKNYM
jgi:hypothetical protein